MSRRFTNNEAYIGDALSYIRDEDLSADVEAFREQCLPNVNCDRLKRAAIVGKHPKTYEDISRGTWTGPVEGLVELDGEEKQALVAERDSAMPERGMLVVILAVSLAAFLQGHVQTSINGASLYREAIGLPTDSPNQTTFGTSSSSSNSGNFWANRSIMYPSQPSQNDWYLGLTNAVPFFGAALLGCWMALPFSDRFGRRGSMVVAATVVMVTSILMAIVPVISTSTPKWQILLGIRIVNGIGMGIKAVNTPVLASETAVGYWRGTSILAWQLWVACGIFVGFILNFIFSRASDENFALALILGAPVVPSIVLLCALAVCPESPRFYLRRGPKYSPEKAYTIIKTLRRCDLIAMRDIYLLHKSIQREVESQYEKQMDLKEFVTFMRRSKYNIVGDFTKQLGELFSKRRNRNPLISSSIAALAQQLCGRTFFNIFANNKSTAMYFSIGFAIRRIDTLGRRKWLLMTLPLMALMMAAAALSFLALFNSSINEVHTIFYSPGLGPIPFVLAAESFPLSHREIGCAFAIAVNLLFAGFLSLFFPSSPGTLGLFSFFNLLAWVLVFLFVEETRRISLEDLDFIYSVSKTKFWKYQLYEYLPWKLRKYSLLFRRRQTPSHGTRDEDSVSEKRRRYSRPQLYKPPDYGDDQLDGDGGSDMEMRTLESYEEGCLGDDAIGHVRSSH